MELDDIQPPQLTAEELAEIHKLVTVENLNRIMESLWRGDSLRADEHVEPEPVTKAPPSTSFWVYGLMTGLILVAMVMYFPEALPSIVTPFLESPSLTEWLRWVDRVADQDWPPTVSVWGVLTHSEEPQQTLDSLMVARFEKDDAWDTYFASRDVDVGREQIIQAAIDTYKDKHYAAATTLFLSQVDGIIYDLTSESFPRPQKSWIENHLKQLPKGLQKWTTAVTETWDRAWASGKPEELEGFNRNRIMHGLGTDFNTPQHALKAAMLVELTWYICVISTLWVELPARGVAQRHGFNEAIKRVFSRDRQVRKDDA